MERIVDKTLVSLMTALMLSVTGIDALSVTALVSGIALSAAFELAFVRPRVGVVLWVGGLVCWLVTVPTMIVLILPLCAYDMARLCKEAAWSKGEQTSSEHTGAGKTYRAAHLVWAFPLILLMCIKHGTIAISAACALLCVVAGLLSVRTVRMKSLDMRLKNLRDRLNEQVIALDSKNRQLADAREYEKSAAVLSERTRIARELHDSVGHLLTRASLQVRALEVVHTKSPNVVKDLNQVLETIDGALDAMRVSVHALDDDAIDVPVLLNRFAHESGIVDVAVECTLDTEMPPAVARCIIALARESLTNAARHARAHTVHLRVTEYPAFWQMVVSNDGKMPTLTDKGNGQTDTVFADLAGHGMGLRSMDERVAGLHGTMRVTVSQGFFTIFAMIPKGM